MNNISQAVFRKQRFMSNVWFSDEHGTRSYRCKKWNCDKGSGTVSFYLVSDTIFWTMLPGQIMWHEVLIYEQQGWTRLDTQNRDHVDSRVTEQVMRDGGHKTERRNKDLEAENESRQEKMGAVNDRCLHSALDVSKLMTKLSHCIIKLLVCLIARAKCCFELTLTFLISICFYWCQGIARVCRWYHCPDAEKSPGGIVTLLVTTDLFVIVTKYFFYRSKVVCCLLCLSKTLLCLQHRFA